jgi:hypothetical protein
MLAEASEGKARRTARALVCSVAFGGLAFTAIGRAFQMVVNKFCETCGTLFFAVTRGRRALTCSDDCARGRKTAKQAERRKGIEFKPHRGKDGGWSAGPPF